jgi:CBS domain-containing protein
MIRPVKDLMHQGLFICHPDSALGQVAALLAQYHIHALVVAEKEDNPLGIISDFDLLAGEWLSVDHESLAAMQKLTARELMSSPIASIEADTSVEEAAHRMIEKQTHRLLVLEKNAPVGVISVSDLVASMAEQVKAKREIVGDVMTYALLVCRDTTSVISVARTMNESRWRSIVVVNAAGKPQGVVTGKDLLRLVGNDVSENLTVGSLMHRPLTTIDINASLNEAADLMIQNHLHRLVVTDKSSLESFPLGIISSFDIVAEMARPGSIWQS